MDLHLDLFVVDTVELLSECQIQTKAHFLKVDALLEKFRPQIEAAIAEGLASDKDGAYIALKLLKLHQESVQLKHMASVRNYAVNKPLQESQFLIAIAGQIFHQIREWMRINNIDKITVETLPDLEEFITLELLVANGYRRNYRVDESE